MCVRERERERACVCLCVWYLRPAYPRPTYPPTFPYRTNGRKRPPNIVMLLHRPKFQKSLNRLAFLRVVDPNASRERKCRRIMNRYSLRGNRGCKGRGGACAGSVARSCRIISNRLVQVTAAGWQSARRRQRPCSEGGCSDGGPILLIGDISFAQVFVHEWLWRLRRRSVSVVIAVK